MPKIVVLISGYGYNLQAIIDATVHEQLSAQVAMVVSDHKAAYGLVRAQRAGIPTQCFEDELFPNREQFDRAVLECLAPIAPDWIVLAGFLRILSPLLIQAFPNRIVNVHPSLLPKYPGLDAPQQAIDAQDTVTGGTIHVVTEQLDAGPILGQTLVRMNRKDTLESLSARINQAECRFYPYILQLLVSKRMRIQDQQILLDDEPLGPEGIQVWDDAFEMPH